MKYKRKCLNPCNKLGHWWAEYVELNRPCLVTDLETHFVEHRPHSIRSHTLYSLHCLVESVQLSVKLFSAISRAKPNMAGSSSWKAATPRLQMKQHRVEDRQSFQFSETGDEGRPLSRTWGRLKPVIGVITELEVLAWLDIL